MFQLLGLHLQPVLKYQLLAVQGPALPQTQLRRDPLLPHGHRRCLAAGGMQVTRSGLAAKRVNRHFSTRKILLGLAEGYGVTLLHN